VGIIDHGRLIALGTPHELKKRVGEVVVEIFGRSGTEYRFFPGREAALEYAGGHTGNVVIRAANLEDVYVELTGRRVGD